MTELIFLVEDDVEGGFVARALGPSIVTQAETFSDLRQAVHDAVMCHFDDADRPRLLRLHYVRDEVLSL
ncbi:MAG: 2-oxoisovalerate dehydrogenase [Firmicutes bacterium]|nr:2-oxoisovalerate dehydrogenase [Bacillota bacterium]